MLSKRKKTVLKIILLIAIILLVVLPRLIPHDYREHHAVTSEG